MTTKKARPAPPVPPDRERVVWLLEFLRRDLTALRPGERLDLRDDLDRLLVAAVDLGLVEPPDGWAFALAKRAGDVPADLSWPDSLVLDVQARLREGIARLEAGQTWQPLTKPRATIFRIENGAIVRRYLGGTYGDVLLASAVDLLVQWWPQLRRCAYTECSVLFLPEEGRQKYHDPRCSGRARWHRLPPRDLQKEKERRVALQNERERKEKERRVLKNGPVRGRKGDKR